MQRTDAPNPGPKYLINPQLQPTTWMAHDWAVTVYRNRSWLNSIWIGTAVNFLNLPQRFYACMISPWLRGDWGLALFGMPAMLAMTLTWLVMGLLGWLILLPYDKEIVDNAEVLEPEQLARPEIAAAFVEGKPVVPIRD